MVVMLLTELGGTDRKTSLAHCENRSFPGLPWGGGFAEQVEWHSPLVPGASVS